MRDIKEFSRHTIRLGGIKYDLRMIIHDIHKYICEFLDRHIFTRSNIEKICTSIVVHQVYHYLCKIIHIEKLTTSRSCSPYTKCSISSEFRCMHPRYHSWNNMSSLGIEVISRAIDIRRHTSNKTFPKLFGNIFTESHPSNLRYCISLIRRFEFPRHEIFFLHRLWTLTRIDTTTSEK